MGELFMQLILVKPKILASPFQTKISKKMCFLNVLFFQNKVFFQIFFSCFCFKFIEFDKKNSTYALRWKFSRKPGSSGTKLLDVAYMLLRVLDLQRD